jgi:hypothetical protein
MSRTIALLSVCIALAGIHESPAAAEGLDIPAAHHAWGRFQPGSWARLRVTRFTTMPDGSEQVAGSTITTTKLVSVEPDGVTLETSTAEDGQQAVVATARLGWDEQPVETERALRLSVGEIKIDGRTFVCQTHELTRQAEGVTTVAKWWYCPDRPPYLLKRVERNSVGPPRFLSVETTALDIEREVLGRQLTCHQTRTVETLDTRSTQTIAINCFDIPGGTVSWEAQTRDKAKGQVEASRAELEAYEIAP